MNATNPKKTTVTASPAALELLVLLQESPGVPLAVRMMPAYRDLMSKLRAWVIEVERRTEPQR